MSPRNEYSDTVRDLHALIRREAADNKRQSLADNVDKMATQLERQRDQLTDVRVLEERLNGLSWLVKSVIVTVALEIVAGIVVALLLKGH
jgi:hypothetical protein